MARDGWDKFERDFRGLQKTWEPFLNDFLLDLALQWLVYTKVFTPVESGELRKSWQISAIAKKGAALEITLYNTAEHAQAVEEGHKIVVGGQTVGYREGRHMASISLAEVEAGMPQKYGGMFHRFISQLDG